MGNLLCCVQVDQSTVAMKEGFGKFEEVLQPGCHCMPWFLGKRIAGHLSLRLQQLDIKCETKTKVSLLLSKTSIQPNLHVIPCLSITWILSLWLRYCLIFIRLSVLLFWFLCVCINWSSLSLVYGSGRFQYSICMRNMIRCPFISCFSNELMLFGLIFICL